ncbi:MAG: HEAT repeat domain-containing protein [bacterium]
MIPLRSTLGLAICLALGATAAWGSCRSRGREAAGPAPRADAAVKVLPTVSWPEPWDELAAVSPTGELTLSDPLTPNLDLRALRVGAREPPAPPAPPRWLKPSLTKLAALTRQGDSAAAQVLTGDLLRARRMDARALAAFTSVACVDCVLAAVEVLRQRLVERSWAWAETRWLLPLCGHVHERVRAAALHAFAGAATQLGVKTLRRQLDHFLRVFRSLTADPSPLVRARALTLLGRLHDRTAHRLLVAATRDRFPAVRIAAVEALFEAVRPVPGAPSTKRVCALLDDPSPTVRATVLTSLPRLSAPCPMERIVALLNDPAQSGLRRHTDVSGSHGPLGPSLPVREAAYWALPPAFRAGRSADAPLRRRIAAALRLVRELRPALLGRPPARLRPMRPLPAKLPQPPEGLQAATNSLLTALLAAGGAKAFRRLLQSRAKQAAVAMVLPRLHAASLIELLGVAEVTLRGPLLLGVVGLLAHASPAVRRAALARLGSSTVDDRRAVVLRRALWLAREDPQPLVRRAALRLLAAWDHGAAVRDRALNSVGDRHPAVRHLAIPLAVRLAPRRALPLLPQRLAGESPGVRAVILRLLIRRPSARPMPLLVARALDDVSPSRIVVPLGNGTETVIVGGSFGTVRGAVLSALEQAFGPRHRGDEAARAKRWQDDLLRLGWKL